MCGIVGAIAKRDIVKILIDGLKRLEYRGYDSSGIAILDHSVLHCVRRVGRVGQLESLVQQKQIAGCLGIGHTRWATHGNVTEFNAHPQISNSCIALVHNGIIENHEIHRESLIKLGYRFSSQTDTEVIAHFIDYFYQQSGDLVLSVRQTIKKLQGAYAICVMASDKPEELVAAQHGCPLLVGLGEGENFIASDLSAVLSVTRRIIFLEEGDIVRVSLNDVNIFNLEGIAITRETKKSNVLLASIELGQYKHFMQKEIYEQPAALADTIEVIQAGFTPALFGATEKDFAKIEGVQILACGTSYYAGLIAKHWIESIAKLPCLVEISSEYRYRDAFVNPNYLIVTISQSGETLDTMEAQKIARLRGHHALLSVCNVKESSIPRASDFVFYTQAGIEIGVASTKAFVTQLVALFALSVTLGRLHKNINLDAEKKYLKVLEKLPSSVQYVLNLAPQIASWAAYFAKKEHVLFLGRGIHYPVALEGALKLKEISYIHAEAYPAGELKHGPLALIDENMPVVVIAPKDKLLEKVKANMQEVRVRGGELFVFVDQDSCFVESDGVHIIQLLKHFDILSPIIHTIPVQLLAYHTAIARGTDVDKPRNLAKSVTVE